MVCWNRNRKVSWWPVTASNRARCSRDVGQSDRSVRSATGAEMLMGMGNADALGERVRTDMSGRGRHDVPRSNVLSVPIHLPNEIIMRTPPEAWPESVREWRYFARNSMLSSRSVWRNSEIWRYGREANQGPFRTQLRYISGALREAKTSRASATNASGKGNPAPATRNDCGQFVDAPSQRSAQRGNHPERSARRLRNRATYRNLVTRLDERREFRE